MNRITSGLRSLLRVQELGVLVALVLICAFLTFKSESFLTTLNLVKVARQASYYGILAVGMVFVIVMGDIDLSVGSVMMLSSMVMAILLRDKYPIVVAFFAALLTGATCGALNGLFSVLLRIPMIIVTLGTLSLYKGIALLFCQGQPISEFPPGIKENWFFTVGGGQMFHLPTSIVVMVALCGVAWIAFEATVHGRRVQAIGGNPQAARLSGLPIARYRIGVMALNGLISALAGVVSLAFLESADPNAGTGFELWTIASVIIGGTALSGGVGSVPGAVLGALIIAVINNGIVLLGYSPYAGVAVTGAVIILAVAIDSLVKRRASAVSTIVR